MMTFHTSKESNHEEQSEGAEVFFRAISGFRVFEIHKTRRIQGKMKTAAFGKLNQKWLFDFHEAHKRGESISGKVKEKEKQVVKI